MSTRSVALENVISILENGRPLHLVLADSLKSLDTEADRAFVARLTRGVVERKTELDEIIQARSSVRLQKQKPVIRNILRCGIYQILYMDSVTDFAACDESVKLAGKRGFRQLGGFVNGILRNVCRDTKLRTAAVDKIPGKDCMAGELALKYSMPEWITEYLLENYGAEKTESVFKYFLNDNDISIRCNLSRISPEELEKRLLEASADYTRSPYCDKWFKLRKFRNIEANREYREGMFVIQDLSSGLTGLLDTERLCLGDPQSVRVLDLCAAPGGKALHMADYGFSVTACDVSSRKTDMIRSAAKRCGFDNIEVLVNDATVLREDFLEAYDIVLCDLPCSGLGIIGKKPDIKYNITPDKQTELVKLQRKILDNAIKYVKKGGILIYSTCTINKQENEEQAAYIANKETMRPEAVLKLPAELAKQYEEKKLLQLLPGEFGTDGFFFATFIRNE